MSEKNLGARQQRNRHTQQPLFCHRDGADEPANRRQNPGNLGDDAGGLRLLQMRHKHPRERGRQRTHASAGKIDIPPQEDNHSRYQHDHRQETSRVKATGTGSQRYKSQWRGW